MISPLRLLLLLGFLGLVANAPAVIYLTQDQALAMAFEDPSSAKGHAIQFDDIHRRAIEEQLEEKVPQKGVLAYTGRLKSGGEGAVLFDRVIGKHEFIDYMLALDHKGRVRFVEILTYSESYGGEVRDQNWRKQFTGLSPKNPPEHEKNIVNISGATLSCRHVTEGVRKLLAVAAAYAAELGLKN